MKRADLVLLACVLLIAGAGFLFLSGRGKGADVVVYTDGQETARYLLSESVSVVLEGYDGGQNRLEISGGEAFLSEADCPDLLCVKQGGINRSGESIICLPHRIVISIEGGAEPEADAIAR